MKLRNRNPGPAPAPPFEGHGPDGAERATFAAGCFWGVEAAFRQIHGVVQTAVGYTGGHVADPSYERVGRYRTGHAEAVEVWFDPAQVSYAELLEVFWRIHNPTTRNRQGLDFGSQYRSAIFCTSEAQRVAAEASRDAYAERVREAGYPEITTEITEAGPFYYAEDYHQQYLAKNPWGYCGLGGTGVSCPVGVGGGDGLGDLGFVAGDAGAGGAGGFGVGQHRAEQGQRRPVGAG